MAAILSRPQYVNLFKYHHRGCLNNPIFSNVGLCAVCWTHFMCHHELWPTSVSHPFSLANISLGLIGGQYCRKITIPIFRHVLKNFALSGCFPYILFYCYPFSFLLSGWFVLQYVALCQSGNYIRATVIVNQCRLPSPMTCQHNECPHFF